MGSEDQLGFWMERTGIFLCFRKGKGNIKYYRGTSSSCIHTHLKGEKEFLLKFVKAVFLST
jgi:hypothetical protein